MTQNETVSPKTQVFTDIRVIFTDFIRLDVLGFFFATLRCCPLLTILLA